MKTMFPWRLCTIGFIVNVAVSEACEDVNESNPNFYDIKWAWRTGFAEHPEWYTYMEGKNYTVNASSSRATWQCITYLKGNEKRNRSHAGDNIPSRNRNIPYPCTPTIYCPKIPEVTEEPEKAPTFPWWAIVLIGIGALCSLGGLVAFVLMRKPGKEGTKKKKRALKVVDATPHEPEKAASSVSSPVQVANPVQFSNPVQVVTTLAPMYSSAAHFGGASGSHIVAAPVREGSFVMSHMPSHMAVMSPRAAYQHMVDAVPFHTSSTPVLATASPVATTASPVATTALPVATTALPVATAVAAPVAVHNQPAIVVHSQPAAMSVHSQPAVMSVHNQPAVMSVHNQPAVMSVHNQPAVMSVHNQPAGIS